MHPAYSVILFTTASGAGYGLLVMLAVLGVAGLVPTTRMLGLVGFALALGLISAGLLSSTFHLGRPERAWRAMTQWRSSWLSREGLAAVATFVPAGILGLTWVWAESLPPEMAAVAVAAVVLAIFTVVCTGMIYASLPTIRHWHQPLVTPVYVALALATGTLLAHPLLLAFGASPPRLGLVAAALTAVAGGLKVLYWRVVDSGEPAYTVEQATGLGKLGKVRPVIPAHTRANYVMREMGFQVARKHALRLRQIVLVAGFAVPALLSVLAALPGSPLDLVLALAAAASACLGVLVERWLFFAEAKHVVTLYYGESRA